MEKECYIDRDEGERKGEAGRGGGTWEMYDRAIDQLRWQTGRGVSNGKDSLVPERDGHNTG